MPAMFMGLIEGGAFEVLTIYAGLIGVNELGANTIITNLCFVFYMLPLGIAIASTSLIGQELGKGNHKNAKMLYQSTYLLAVVTAIPLIFILWWFNKEVIYLYTNNTDIIDSIEPVIFILLVIVFFDNIQGALKGVIRGIGKLSFKFSVQ